MCYWVQNIIHQKDNLVENTYFYLCINNTYIIRKIKLNSLVNNT